MVYFKIVKNDTIIAVEAHPTPVYVYKQRNGVVIRCSAYYAQGILSIDGSTIYQLEDKPVLDDNLLIATKITTAEYLNLVDTLDELPEEEVESDTEIENEPAGEKVMTTVEMRARILELEAELEAQTQTNKEQLERQDFLEECILEMSEVIYG